MADQFVLERPNTPHIINVRKNITRHAIFRLVRTMIAAGWTVVESSTGLGFAGTYAADNWTDYVSLFNNFAWIVLEANSGQQILIRFSTTAVTDEGWIVWFPAGGYTVATNQTDVLPSDMPTLRLQVRGTSSGTQTYSSDGPLLGATVNIQFRRYVIRCADATGTGDESFYIFAVDHFANLDSASNSVHGRLAFEKLVHNTNLGIVDPYPYAWWAPQSLTSTWTEGMDDLRSVITEDDSGGTTGRWRRIWNAGQGSQVEKTYGSGHLYQGDDAAANAGLGDGPFWEIEGAQPIYQASGGEILGRIHLTKELETAFKDVDGGWTQNIFIIEANETSFSQDYRVTLDGGNLARIGRNLVVRWSGNVADIPPR